MSSTKTGPIRLHNFRYTTSEDTLRSPLDPAIFKEITILKTISIAKFPVYLVSSLIDGKCYAMKVFSTKGNKNSTYFLNETRFACLHHKNVIQIFHYEQENIFISKATAPYVIMEYAPFGDLFDFIRNFRSEIDDKLIRTYFRQLIEGVEYLHIKGIAHLDLKLENLLIGEDFMLKIADFDLSYIIGDEKVYSKGTKYYRSPDFQEGKCQNYWAFDMYAVGIILFALKTRGLFPHSENKIVCGVNLFQLLYEDNSQFWTKHAEILEVEESFFEKEFRELFNGLIEINPELRLKAHEVKKSEWYNGPIYTKEELKLKNKEFYGSL